MKTISIIIPAYNEEPNVEVLFNRLKEVVPERKYSFEYLFIDDGSRDGTLTKVQKLSELNTNVFFIQLSRNFGHQNAIKAGLDHAKGDAVISMDSDLQHPPEVILKLIEKWEEGYDVVYTRRVDKDESSWFKRKTSALFYSIHNQLSDLKIEKGTADFRLMSRQVVNAFSQLRESELFIRGLVKWAGFKQAAIDYIPSERYAGKTKYSTGQMISFALKGITSFGTRPLKLVAYLALVLFLLSMLLIPYALISLMMGEAVSGWTSLMITVIIFGSMQLLVLAIVGIYISKLVIQSKDRPLYLIKDSNYVQQ